MAKPKSMKNVTARGDRLEELENLALMLAAHMDNSEEDARNLPQLARQYRETIREIQEIRDSSDGTDEIGEIIKARGGAGKSRADKKISTGI